MKINRLLAAAVAISLAAAAFAQNGTLTPYSRYGYGILNDNATSAQRAMGGVGYAMNSGRQINVMNPASYAAIDSLTFLFDMGVNFDVMHSQEGDLKENNFSAGLDYITMAFPLSQRMGASLGLLPYSSTGYQFAEAVTHGSITRTGNGDINMLYAGVAYELVKKHLYIGANLYYTFGTTVNDAYAYTITGSTSLFERYLRVRDWRAEIGLQYAANINATDRLTVGLTFTPGKGLRGETYGVHYDTSVSSAAIDTTGYTKLNGKYSLAASYGAGISYYWRNKLLVEADVLYQPWSKAKYEQLENFENSQLDNRYQVAVGMQYTPNPRGSYWQRAQLRCGAYYNHDYLMVHGNNVREYGVTAGIGFPVPQFKTMVNLGLEYKHRQAHPTPLIKENYLCITLGINFNEMWFRKSKIY